MHKYQLIVKIPFEAMDDIDARKHICSIMNTDPIDKIQEVYEVPVEVKLQEIFENKAPRGIAVEINN